MEEADWVHVPRDARELFVVLNGCEWRKRTNGAMNFDPVKFKAITWPSGSCSALRLLV
jgi:hypothetical protein